MILRAEGGSGINGTEKYTSTWTTVTRSPSSYGTSSTRRSSSHRRGRERRAGDKERRYAGGAERSQPARQGSAALTAASSLSVHRVVHSAHTSHHTDHK